MNYKILIRELTPQDKTKFIEAMKTSANLHTLWVKAPLTSQEFDEYYDSCQQSNKKSFLLCNNVNNILGVFNVSEIVRGFFQSAYLGFYSVTEYAGKGYMSKGLKLVLHKVFNELLLHRIEANIQPENTQSIHLVQNNGFRKEGFSPRYLKVNGEWRDHERWAITLEDWTLMDKK